MSNNWPWSQKRNQKGQRKTLLFVESFASHVKHDSEYGGFVVPHTRHRRRSLMRLETCDCAWGPMGASQTTHTGRLKGTLELQYTQLPIWGDMAPVGLSDPREWPPTPSCMACAAGMAGVGSGRNAFPQVEQNRTNGSAGLGAKQ